MYVTQTPAASLPRAEHLFQLTDLRDLLSFISTPGADLDPAYPLPGSPKSVLPDI